MTEFLQSGDFEPNGEPEVTQGDTVEQTEPHNDGTNVPDELSPEDNPDVTWLDH